MKNISALSLLFLLTGCLTENVVIELPPVPPVNLSVTPASPASDTTPTVTGQTSPSVSLVLYSGANCSGFAVATGQASTSGSFALTSGILPSGDYNFSVEASNGKGKICSYRSVAYSLTSSVPTVAISAPSVSIANLTHDIDFTVTYTGADDVDLQDADVFLSTTGTATCPTKTITGGTTSIPIVTLSDCSGDGTVGITVGPGTATNVAGSSLASNLSGTFTVDNTGITTATYDVASGTVTSIPTTLVVTFPETILGTTLTTSDFAISGDCGVLPNHSLTALTSTTATISLTPATCGSGQQVIVTLDLTAFTDAASNPGTGTAVATYTFDSSGPVSATYNPVAGNVAAIPASVDVIFDEDVDPATVSAGTFNVTGTCSPLPTASLTGVVGDTATVGLTGGTCTTGQTVDIAIDLTTVTDTSGNAGVGATNVTYTFDDVGPAALSITPGTSTVGSSPVSVDVTFDEDVLIGSVAAGDLVVTGDCATPPTVSVSSVASGSTITFDLNGASCASGETVIVTLDGTSITDTVGNAGTGTATATFTLDLTGPSVSSVTPPTSTLTSLPASVVFNFDEPVDPTTVSLADISTGGSCATPPTLGDGGATGSDFTVTLSGAVCASGETFSLTFSHPTITDTFGNAGVGSTTVTYTLDSDGPTISGFTPVGGAPPASMDFNMSENIDPASVDPSDFVLSNTCTGVSVGSAVASGSVITLTFAGSCNSAEILDITFDASSVTDTVGNVGSGSVPASYTQP